MGESITNLSDAVRELGALPVPWPAAPRSEEERLRMEVVRLEDLLATAVKNVARANRERDLMRERVSEPFGCTHCGEAQRFHGRRYNAGAGVHSWERPSDEQVKARMLARRVARFSLPRVPELDQLHEELTGVNLALYEEELENARLRLALASARRGRRELRAQVAALLAERHVTNEALDDAVQELRAREGRSADRLTRMLAPTQALRETGGA